MPITEQDLRAHFGRKPDRLNFQSAGAVPPQFRERNADRQRNASTVRIAFSDLLVGLADHPPADIIGNATADDLEELAEHFHKILKAVEGYLNAGYTDMKQRTSGLDLDVNVAGILSDTRGDLVSTLKIAAEQMRAANQAREFDEYERWFGEFD